MPRLQVQTVDNSSGNKRWPALALELDHLVAARNLLNLTVDNIDYRSRRALLSGKGLPRRQQGQSQEEKMEETVI